VSRGVPDRERDKMIVSLRISGESIAEIARAYNLTPARISAILLANGIRERFPRAERRPAAPPADSFSYDDLVAALGKDNADKVVSRRNLAQIRVALPSNDELMEVVAVLKGQRLASASSWLKALGQ